MAAALAAAVVKAKAKNSAASCSSGAVLAGMGNAREQLAQCEHWLGWQDENLSAGLRSPEDALKLYRYWLSRRNLPEMADEQIDDDCDVAKHRIAALGYDPLAMPAA